MEGLQAVKTTLKSLRISDPGTVTVKKLDQDYKQMIGDPIPYRTFGYNNLTDFLRSLNDILAIEGYGLNAVVNAHVSNSSSHIQRFVSVAKNRPSDRRSSNNRTNDRNNRNKPAQYYFQEEKFESAKVVSSAVLADGPEYDEWNPPSKPDPHAVLHQSIRFPKTKAKAITKVANEHKVSAGNFCKTIPSFKMPACINEFTVYPIIVTDVKSPNEFWFQICKTDELPTLMAQLDMFYNKLSATDHQIVEFNVGLFCACLVDKVWYRGRITKVISDQETVEIVLCDMGLDTVVVAENHVKYLTPDFGQLCQQLGRGSLHGVRPLGDATNWRNDDIKLFEKMVSNRILYAKNVHHNADKDIVTMLLVNTNGPADLEINKFLITECVAQLQL